MDSLSDGILIDLHGAIERIERLEDKVFKKHKDYPATATQKLLLLKYLGMLEAINGLCDSDLKKSKVLSTLIGASEENIRHNLSEINGNNLLTENNKKFLTEATMKAGLDTIAKEIQKDFTNSKNKKGKKE